MANAFDQFDAPAGDITARREADRAHIYADELALADPDQKPLIEKEMLSNNIPGAPAAGGGNPFDRFDQAAPKEAPKPVPVAPERHELTPTLNAAMQPGFGAPRGQIPAPPQSNGYSPTAASPLLRQGAAARGNFGDPGVMDPRYPAYRKAQDQAEGLSVGADIVGSALPMVGPAWRGARAMGEIMRPPAMMRGGGAAETAVDTLRRSRASDLPVPIELTRGQATRDFGQQQFEKETAKSPKLGEPLRERFSDQNKKMLLNFDSWVDETGAVEPSLRGAGKTVVGAIEKKAQKAKSEIKAAYDEARNAGELAAPVKTDSLVKYIESTRPEAINAPVLSSVEQKLIQLGGAKMGPEGRLIAGEIPLNDLEELRKMINRVSDSTPTNGRFGTEVKKVIDAATEGAGGTVYARARRLRQRYAQEFEEQGVIDKMIRTKPGTSDRAVAYEDVFNHAILNGSLDDMRNVRRVLQTQGEEGKQAWKELQGQAVTHLKETAIKGVSTDQAGNSIISPAALNKAVQSLDRDGKLEYLFGKKGAQQIRDVADLAKDVHTAPPGSVNSSNTATILLTALDSAGSALTGLPAPLATGFKLLKEQMAGRAVKKKVRAALTSPSGQIPPPP